MTSIWNLFNSPGMNFSPKIASRDIQWSIPSPWAAGKLVKDNGVE